MSQNQAKTAIVTGAAGGIGKELVRRLAERNINVVLVDLKGKLFKLPFKSWD